MELQDLNRRAGSACLPRLQASCIRPIVVLNSGCFCAELFPHANTSNGWLDALDPLFDTIGHGVGEKMQAEFGPASFVEADGWFSLETGARNNQTPAMPAVQVQDGLSHNLILMMAGPWLASEAAIAYHEDTLQALGSGASTEDVLAATFGLDLRSAEGEGEGEGGCLGDFVIPSEEEAFTRCETSFLAIYI